MCVLSVCVWGGERKMVVFGFFMLLYGYVGCGVFSDVYEFVEDMFLLLDVFEVVVVEFMGCEEGEGFCGRG